MKFDFSDDHVLIYGSPIEFVVIGPVATPQDSPTLPTTGQRDVYSPRRAHRRGRDYRDRIIVKTDTAQLDLIGYAIEARSFVDEERMLMNANALSSGGSSIFFSLFRSKRRQMNKAFSGLLESRSVVEDRESKYLFAWIGECSELEMKLVEMVLRLRIDDFQEAILGRDPHRLEWFLAPVIRRCINATENQQKRNIYMRLSTILAASTVILSGSIAVIIEFLRSLAKK